MKHNRELKRQWIRHRYRVDWLHPEDATSVANLEARVHTVAHRAGSALIAEQLAITAEEGRNLSLGLYRGRQLVGFLLAFVAKSRREISSFFDAPLPPGRDPDERTVYLADFVVLPRHRSGTSLLSSKLASILLGRDDLRSLTADAFSTEEYAAFWRARSKLFMRLGWQIGGQSPFHDDALGTTMYWLTFDPIHGAGQVAAPGVEAVLKTPLTIARQGKQFTVGHIDTTLDWAMLEPWWNTLLEKRADPVMFQSYAYLRSWWAHIGAVNDLFMPVVVREGAVVAIAPLQITSIPWMGQQLRCLTFMNGSPEVSAGSILAAAGNDSAVEVLGAYIAARSALWDCVRFTKQTADDPFLASLAQHLREAGLVATTVDDVALGKVVPTLSWEEYRDALPATLSQELGRAAEGLVNPDDLQFEVVTAASGWQPLLDRFTAIEVSAPESSQYQGIGVTSANLSFYLDVAARHGESLGMTCGFLRQDGEDIAAVCGFQSRNCYYPVHVTQKASAAEFRADLLATARQFEGLFRRGGCQGVLLTSSRLPFQLDWATEVRPSVTLQAYKRSPAGIALHVLYSVLKPGLKRLRARLH